MIDDYCESCEADRLWETEGIQPVWASPTHACGVHACSTGRRDTDCPECGDNYCRCGLDWTEAPNRENGSADA